MPDRGSRPRSPQEPPSAPQSCAPVRMYARRPLAPSAPFSCTAGMPAPLRLCPQNAPRRSQCPYKALWAVFLFRIHPIGQTHFRVPCACLTCPAASCASCRLAGCTDARQGTVPAAPKEPARRRATFWPRFRAGFYSVFTRILSDLRSAYACLIVAGIVARHSRLIVA